jgi:glycerol-3-phosphate responsive antiterminator
MKINSLKFLLSVIVSIIFFKANTKSLIKSYLSCIDISEIKDTSVYVYITSIKKDKKEVLLFVDFIQYYSNEEAVTKAKERGDADTLYRNGKVIISVPGVSLPPIPYC